MSKAWGEASPAGALPVYYGGVKAPLMHGDLS